MKVLKVIAIIVIAIYLVIVVVLYFMQTRLIFYPGRLAKGFRFNAPGAEEVFIDTQDNERINALFFRGERPEVILYFHGNAGDLSGWQFVAEDFTAEGYNVLIIDFRGYGKSTGMISEKGFYSDAEAAYEFLKREKHFAPQDIIAYGRSIGSGVAVDLASRYPVKGLVLESPYASLKKLANEKLPYLFPSLYMRFHFDSARKIKNVKSPVVLLHGSEDTLIPPSHSEILFKNIASEKKMIVVKGGAHNDLNAFPEYDEFLKKVLPEFFATLKPSK